MPADASEPAGVRAIAFAAVANFFAYLHKIVSDSAGRTWGRDGAADLE
jgi:hypothetical protein